MAYLLEARLGYNADHTLPLGEVLVALGLDSDDFLANTGYPDCEQENRSILASAVEHDAVGSDLIQALLLDVADQAPPRPPRLRRRPSPTSTATG